MLIIRINEEEEEMFLEHQMSMSIRMISEGSCDTEDWSNDAVNSALPSNK